MPKTHERSQLHLAILFGGPSPERGISLNSARSLADHLEGNGIEVTLIYFDLKKRPFLIPRSWLYSSTPLDFDFKLASHFSPLSQAELRKKLRGVDLAFPAIHGKFGEDGEIQGILEEIGCPIVGPSSDACKQCFDKFNAQEQLKASGFYSLPSLLITKDTTSKSSAISKFFREHKIKRAIVKPAQGGSSIGVYSVANATEAAKCVDKLLASKNYSRVVVEEFAAGKEFTAVILQNRFGLPVSLLPVEIDTAYDSHQIFDYRKKYLPTMQAAYHCPPRFALDDIERIQRTAEQLFAFWGLRDFARFDGWIFPDGKIWFSDFNLISGMEQNSFLFIQAARLGMSHRDVLYYIIKSAARRYGIKLKDDPVKVRDRRVPINVIFGGDTAERQVSVMSGTNVWLKLKKSKEYAPVPYLLDKKGQVWELPYALTLNHSAEEIQDSCERALKNAKRDAILREKVLAKLMPQPGDVSETPKLPRRMSLRKFLSETDHLFIGLHGGFGEDGGIQAACERMHVSYNGSGPGASYLCMDKFKTGLKLKGLTSSGIFTAKKIALDTARLKKLSSKVGMTIWKDLVKSLKGLPLLVKPNADGCSAGVVLLHSYKDFTKYLHAVFSHVPRIPAGTLEGQDNIVEMPINLPTQLLFEEFIKSSRVEVSGTGVKLSGSSPWIEVTIGLLGPKGRMRALSPSVTVTGGHILSIEEKFQGGTGINLTPPPANIVSPRIVKRIKSRIETVAKALGLSDYARIDAFVNVKDGRVLVIEANTLPGLTPSTVIFHQALAEPKPMRPVEFLGRIIEHGVHKLTK